MRHRYLLLLQVAFLSIMAVYGCTIYHKPRPSFDVPFRERSQSKVDGDVRVTVAVLSAEESRQLFGVNLAGKDIQPVWIRVQNADTVAYWLMSAGLDPDYFSPLEAAKISRRPLFAEDGFRPSKPMVQQSGRQSNLFCSAQDTDTRPSVLSILVNGNRI